jgi:hypothetical protein
MHPPLIKLEGPLMYFKTGRHPEAVESTRRTHTKLFKIAYYPHNCILISQVVISIHFSSLSQECYKYCSPHPI